MEAKHTQCEECGLPIIFRTHERHGGLCKGCFRRSQAKNKPPVEFKPECFDPIESDPRYLDVVDAVDQLALNAARDELRKHMTKTEVADDLLPMGSCHVVWHHKKRLLKERYNIEWKSPSEMNPHMWYD